MQKGGNESFPAVPEGYSQIGGAFGASNLSSACTVFYNVPLPVCVAYSSMESLSQAAAGGLLATYVHRLDKGTTRVAQSEKYDALPMHKRHGALKLSFQQRT